MTSKLSQNQLSNLNEVLATLHFLPLAASLNTIKDEPFPEYTMTQLEHIADLSTGISKTLQTRIRARKAAQEAKKKPVKIATKINPCTP